MHWSSESGISVVSYRTLRRRGDPARSLADVLWRWANRYRPSRSADGRPRCSVELELTYEAACARCEFVEDSSCRCEIIFIRRFRTMPVDEPSFELGRQDRGSSDPMIRKARIPFAFGVKQGTQVGSMSQLRGKSRRPIILRVRTGCTDQAMAAAWRSHRSLCATQALLSAEVSFTAADLFEVKVYRGGGAWTLVAAIDSSVLPQGSEILDTHSRRSVPRSSRRESRRGGRCR